jgi:DNA-binding XRE family transcriptional regulator
MLPNSRAPRIDHLDEDSVAFRLLQTVYEPEVEREELSGEDRHRLAASHLRAARKLKGFTQRALARKLGITESYLQSIETGRRRPSLNVQAKVYSWLLKHNLEHYFFYSLLLSVILETQIL